MYTPSSFTPLGGAERFSTNTTVQTSLEKISELVCSAELNDALAYSSKNYDGLVVFSHVPGERIAVPLSHADGYDVDPVRHRFRNSRILEHSFLLRHTALGGTLHDPTHPQFSQSLINDDMPQILYTNRLMHNDSPVGAIQYSFTPPDMNEAIDDLPDETALEAIWQNAQPEVQAIAREVALLQALSKNRGSLSSALEYKPPIAPNAFVVDWEIDTPMFLDHALRSQMLDAYMNQAYLEIRDRIDAYRDRYGVDQFGAQDIYDDQGNGATIILPIPEAFNTYDQLVRKEYHFRTAAPFMHTIETVLNTVGNQYRHDLHPKVRVSGEFGYVEPNSIGRFAVKKLFTPNAKRSD